MPEIRKEILSLADDKYRQFQMKLLPDTKNIIGVRLPMLRKMAKKIAGKWGREYLEIALNRNPEEELYEEIMLQGMVIGYIREDISDIFSFTERFLPKIDNWAVCDSFCSGFKHAVKYQDEVWEWLNGLLESEEAFTLRYVIVMLLNYYMDENYLESLFSIFDTITHQEYYVKMAVAWAVSICYIEYPKKTMSYLENNKLDDFTYNKALQKITESRCIEAAEKELIKKMKRKGKR